MKKTLAALTLTAVAIGLAPTASADPDNDAAFVAALDIGGIVYSSPSYIVQVGHAVCYDLRHGTTEANEVNGLVLLGAQSGLGLLRPQAWYLLGAAEAAYCPEQE